MHFLKLHIISIFTILLTFVVPSLGQTQHSTTVKDSTISPRHVRGKFSEQPPEITPEIRQKLMEALERTHLPGPPLQVDTRVIRESMEPTESPTPNPSERAQAGQADIILFRNNDLGDGAPSTHTSVIGEPSAAKNGDLIFWSGNWYAALSTDGGQTFNFVNPFTLFPSVNDGFCCDQIVIYEPSRDLWFWLLQYLHDGATNTQRLAVAAGSDNLANLSWTYYDFTPQLIGLPDSLWLDFPDLSFSDNYLYISTNVFDMEDVFTNAAMIRIPLDSLANLGTITFNVFTSDQNSSFRGTHGATTKMYWGSHNTVQQIRVFSWEEGVNQVFTNDVNIAAWIPDSLICPSPDGNNACGRADWRILGAWVAEGIIGFMWNVAQQDTTYPYPQIKIARINESDMTLIDNKRIWNSFGAFIYPSVAVNARGDIGGTFFFSGGDFYPSTAVWIWDDSSEGFIDLSYFISSTNAPSSDKWGDYLAARPDAQYPNSWIGTGYSLIGGAVNVNARPRYVWFGREEDGPISVDDEPDNQAISFYLEQNYPNPFNPTTSIEYTLLSPKEVSLIIYNLLGQEVINLVNEGQQAGYHKVTWDASSMASGIYFYRLQAGDFVQTRKMVLLR